MIHGAVTLVRLRGVPLRLHWSLLVIVPYLALVFSAAYPELTRTAGVTGGRVTSPLLWGVLVALGLFASVAVHELAHALVALRAGGRVRDVTLMAIGGVSRIERIAPGRGIEAVMAAAGPATSLALGVVLLAVQDAWSGASPDLRLGLFYLGSINIALGVFNMVPAFPMDGGRVLRSLLELRLGRARATSIAAAVGKVFAVGFAIVGLWSGNVLLLLIALFVYTGAAAEAGVEQIRAALSGVRVRDVMDRHPPEVTPALPIAEAPARMRDAGRTELVVVDDAHHPLGLVRAADLVRVPVADRAAKRLADLGGVVERSAVIVPRDVTAVDALERAQEAGVEFVIVVDPEQIVAGLVGRREIERALTLRELGYSSGQSSVAS